MSDKCIENQFVLNLTPDPKVLIALTHTHISPLDALCELIDNSIDSFSVAKQQGIKIDSPIVRIELPKISEIDLDKGVFRISDNGPGLSVESAEKALKAGFSGNNQYDTLGLFGMGFNISTGKIGSVTHFITSRMDSDKALEVTIDLNKINASKNYNVEAYSVEKGVLEHGTVITISNWWPEGNTNRGFVKTLVSYGAKKIREELGRRYATILRKKYINIVVNEVPCVAFEHCIWGDSRYVERKKHGRIPAVFRFDTVIYAQKKCLNCGSTVGSNQNVCPECGSYTIRTVEERIKGWVGIQRFDHVTEFGIDLIRNGRAIRISEKSAFFEFEDEFQKTIKDYPIDGTFGRIVGEVHLDHVPVDFMKQDFQRTSPEWHRAIEFLRGNSSLQPTQPGADKNESPIYKLYQGYRKVKVPGKTDMYMGTWDSVKGEPKRISRDVEKDFYQRFKKKEPGYFTDEEWWKKVEEADKKPLKMLPLCPVCGCQNLEEAEVCMGCQTILKGKSCVSCGAQIPFSAKICPKCGASQEAEIIKPWICKVCHERNLSTNDVCAKCGAPKGEVNHLSKEYLIANSDKDDFYSIEDCSVLLANNQNSSSLNISVYMTRNPIKYNFDDKSIPVFTIKDSLSEILIFIDQTHRMFKNCKMSVEQIIASEAAEHIYLLNKSITQASGRHSVAYIAWQIIEKYWADRLEDDSEGLLNNINEIFGAIRNKLILSDNSGLKDCFDLLSDDETKQMINYMLNDGVDIIKISEYRNSLQFLQYVPISYIATLFNYKPEYFFDGIVWNEPYLNLDANEDIKSFTQHRVKSLYQSCLMDLVYYTTYRNSADLVLQKVQIAIKLLSQRMDD